MESECETQSEFKRGVRAVIEFHSGTFIGRGACASSDAETTGEGMDGCGCSDLGGDLLSHADSSTLLGDKNSLIQRLFAVVPPKH